MPRFVYCIHFLCLLFCMGTAYAQRELFPTFINYTTDQGLRSNEVYAVYQDQQGYVWFCTDNGLSRFDGNHFQNFTIDEGMCENTVFYQYESLEEKKIWFVGMSGTVSEYDMVSNQMYCREFNKALQNEVKGAICNFLIATRDSIMVVHPNTTYFANRKTGEVRSKRFQKEAIHLTKYADNPGAIAYQNFGETYDSLYFYEKGTLRQSLGLADHISYGGNIIGGNVDSKYYFLSKQNIHVYDAKQNSLATYLQEYEFVPRLTIDQEKNIWLCSKNNGALMYRNGFIEQPSYSLLSDEHVSCVFQDHEGGYWISTLHSGVFYTPSLSLEIVPQIQEKINNFAVVNNKLYSSCYNGTLYESIFLGEGITHRVVDKFAKHLTGILSIEDTLYTRVADKNNLSVFQSYGSQYTPQIIPESTYYWKMQGEAGQLYFFELMPNDNTLRVFQKGVGNIQDFSLDGSYRKILYRSATRSCYLGRSKGLDYYSENGAIQSIKTKKGVLSYDVRFLYPYKGDTILVGTQGHGLLMVYHDRVLKQWDQSEGALLSDACNSISMDDEGSLWLGTNEGLCIIDHFMQKNESIRRLARIEGLPSDIVYDIAFVDNKVCIASSSGLAFFDKESFDLSLPDLITTIQSIHVNNKLMEVGTEKLLLETNQNNVQISFSDISLRNGLKIPYRYRLFPSDTLWKEVNNTDVYFSSLAPGDYQFEVQSGYDGLKWGSPVSVAFQILVPIWKRWWFIVSGLFLIAVTAWWLVHRRMKRMEKELKLLSDANISRNKMLSAQLNPHFIFNSLNAVGYFTAINEQKEAIGFLTKYTKLIRRVFDHSNELLLPLEEEVTFIKEYLYLEGKRYEDRFHYTVEVDDALLDTYLFPPMLSQPFVENAVWHGVSKRQENGKIEVIFKKEGAQLLCIVRDNGPGYTDASFKNRKHSGVKVSEKRMIVLEELLDKTVGFTRENLVEEDAFKGTEIIIYFPLIKND